VAFRIAACRSIASMVTGVRPSLAAIRFRASARAIVLVLSWARGGSPWRGRWLAAACFLWPRLLERLDVLRLDCRPAQSRCRNTTFTGELRRPSAKARTPASAMRRSMMPLLRHEATSRCRFLTRTPPRPRSASKVISLFTEGCGGLRASSSVRKKTSAAHDAARAKPTREAVGFVVSARIGIAHVPARRAIIGRCHRQDDRSSASENSGAMKLRLLSGEILSRFPPASASRNRPPLLARDDVVDRRAIVLIAIVGITRESLRRDHVAADPVLAPSRRSVTRSAGGKAVSRIAAEGSSVRNRARFETGRSRHWKL